MDEYRWIVEKAPVGLCVVRDGVVVFANLKARELLDISGSEETPPVWKSLFHPEDGDVMEEVEKIGLHPQGPIVARIAAKSMKSVEERWLQLMAVPIEWNGNYAVLWSLSDFTEQVILQEQMRASEELYRKVIESANDGVAIVKGDRHVFVNQRFLDIFGYERPEEVIGKPISMMVHKDDKEMVLEFNLKRQKGEPVPSRYVFKGVRENGAPIFVEVSATRISYEGEPASLVFMRDVTERRWLEDALKRSRDFYLTLFEELPTMIWRLASDGMCDYVNRAWLDFTGRTLEQEMGDGWIQCIHPEDLAEFKEGLLDALANREAVSREVRALRRDGQWRWILLVAKPFAGLEGEFSGYIGACYDITERKQEEEHLHLQATHDPLTALPNRRLLQDRLQVAFAQAARKGSKVAVIMVDLDDFKLVNDEFGHRAGDEILVEVAQRLKGIIRAGDTVARLGGDEFVIVLPEMGSARVAQRVARRIIGTFKEPFRWRGKEISLTPSLGLSIFPDHGGEAEDLIQKADQALYRAKAQGGNRVVLFRPDKPTLGTGSP